MDLSSDNALFKVAQSFRCTQIIIKTLNSHMFTFYYEELIA